MWLYVKQLTRIELGVHYTLVKQWMVYTRQRDLESCAHPTKRGHWWVEMGGLFKVYNVTIYFRQGDCE